MKKVLILTLIILMFTTTFAFATTPTVKASVKVIANTDTTLTVEWKAIENATEYKVYLDGSLVNTVSTTNYKFTGLIKDTSYDIQVSGSDGVGEGPKSTTVSAVAGQGPIKTIFTNVVAVVTGFLTLMTSILVWVIAEPLLLFGLGIGLTIMAVKFGRKLMKSKG